MVGAAVVGHDGCVEQLGEEGSVVYAVGVLVDFAELIEDDPGEHGQIGSEEDEEDKLLEIEFLVGPQTEHKDKSERKEAETDNDHIDSIGLLGTEELVAEVVDEHALGVDEDDQHGHDDDVEGGEEDDVGLAAEEADDGLLDVLDVHAVEVGEETDGNPQGLDGEQDEGQLSADIVEYRKDIHLCVAGQAVLLVAECLLEDPAREADEVGEDEGQDGGDGGHGAVLFDGELVLVVADVDDGVGGEGELGEEAEGLGEVGVGDALHLYNINNLSSDGQAHQPDPQYQVPRPAQDLPRGTAPAQPRHHDGQEQYHPPALRLPQK